MNNRSRVVNSIRNMINGILSQIISVFLSFIVRTFFIKCLDESYLGVNGLFTNILTILSLAELGFGTAMVYSMYKPLAENDSNKLQALMNLYKKVYSIIGVIVGIIGILIIPFLGYVIKDKPNVENLTFIYLMFLLNSVLSYFWAYKRSILSADQKEYISSQYKYIFTIIKSILQIAILVITNNFIFYLLVQIIITVSENIFISIKIDKMYPFLKYKSNEKLSKNELKRIIEDVKALMLSKFGNVMLNGTDNIIISAFVGVKAVGLLSNYTMITGALVMVLSQISSGITGSVGNYIAKENKEDHFKLFNNIDFIMFFIYGFSLICLIILLNPFIELWIGKKFLLKETTVIVLSINFFINGVMNLLWTFRSTMGLFVQGKYRPIITALLNIVVSIILAKLLGLVGVLLGTTISRLLVNLWYDPYIIFKYGFNEKVKGYYLKYGKRIIVVFVICNILFLFKMFLFRNGLSILKFIILMFLCFCTIIGIFFVIYHNTQEFRYLKSIIEMLIGKLQICKFNNVKSSH